MPAELHAPAIAPSSFTFEQDIASTLWTVAHDLGYRPAVTVVDTLGRVLEADVSYVDDDNLTISFSIASTGAAYLS